MNVKKLAAFTASAALILSAETGAFASAAVTDVPLIAEQTVCDTEVSLPDWIPTNFNEALEFSNQYGVVHDEEDYICVVLKCQERDDAYNDIKLSGDIIKKQYLTDYFDKEFHYSSEDIPKAPDPKDEKAYADYMEKYGAYENKWDDLTSDFYFRVAAFPTNKCNVDITVESGRYIKDEPVVSFSHTYSFAYVSSLTIPVVYKKEQTDVFSFLPDCIAEFRDFKKQNGNVSIHGNYIVYCDEVLYAAGTELEVENSNPDALEEIMSYTVSPNYPSYMMTPGGGADNVVKVYKAKASGDVSLKFTKKTNYPERDYDKITYKEFNIKDTSSPDEKYRFSITENSLDIPEWIPSDFSEAMDFSAQYGCTHIKDDCICIVHKISGDRNGYLNSYFCHDKNGDPALDVKLSEKTFTPSNEQLGDNTADIGYRVEVFRLPPSASIYCNYANYNISDKVTKYTFESDSEGKVTETDIFGWLPDCVKETSAYKKNNGMVSVHDKYVVYCNIINAGTGYHMDIDWDSTASIDEYAAYSYEQPQIIPLDGGAVAYVSLYKAKKPGYGTMTFTYGREFESDEKKEKTIQAFRFDDDLKAEMIDEKDLPPVISGDVNHDGVIGISDYVMLKNWLHGYLANASTDTSDMNKDGVIDVFDLIALKKVLINGNTVYEGLKADPEPMLIALYDNNAWGLQQDITVYDENGISYSMSLATSRAYTPDATYSEKIRMSTDHDWYESIVDIMKNEKAVKSQMPDDMIVRTRALSANFTEYSKIKSGKSSPARFDGGTTTYYLIGKNKDGKHDFMKICAEGDIVYISDCEEIKNYVKYGAYDDFFPNCLYFLTPDNNNGTVFDWSVS